MRTRVRVDGMTCQHCIRAVFTALTAVEGIVTADVTLGMIDVDHDGRVTVDQLREAVAVAGYSVGEEERRTLPVIPRSEATKDLLL